MKTLSALAALLILAAAPAQAASAPVKACHDAKGRKVKCPAPTPVKTPGAEYPQPSAAMLAPTMRCHNVKTGRIVRCDDPNAEPLPVN